MTVDNCIYESINSVGAFDEEQVDHFDGRSLPHMKVIPLSEAKAHLSRYARLCVTVKGVPAFQLAPLDENDDLIDRLLKYNPQFRQRLQDRLGEGTITAKEAAQRL